MIQVSIKIKGDEPCKTECFSVESIFTETLQPNKVVLHFAATEPFKRLLNISLKYGWELYRYAEDNHVGLTVNEDEIFWVKYIDQLREVKTSVKNCKFLGYFKNYAYLCIRFRKQEY